jgi:hypothetical protein
VQAVQLACGEAEQVGELRPGRGKASDSFVFGKNSSAGGLEVLLSGGYD